MMVSIITMFDIDIYNYGISIKVLTKSIVRLNNHCVLILYRNQEKLTLSLLKEHYSTGL